MKVVTVVPTSSRPSRTVTTETAPATCAIASVNSLIPPSAPHAATLRVLRRARIHPHRVFGGLREPGQVRGTSGGMG
ncbi:hypothetical protein GCM10010156_15720 [Planobispora rosea]|uniref:Uncharacterized protein n=1 Tax=Planobispora rosea TaxID=35762 RepID=A0A8J3WGI2_PLARO|nr:hypothetical protein GCM10010156_15720 [Planobispora rosea]GIH88458.1 hypothetical protein Pro02_68660 [Planobispora rosea]